MEKFDLHADLESRIYQHKKKSEVPKWIFFGALAIGVIGGALAFLNKDKMAVIFEGPGGKFVHFLKEPEQQRNEPVKPTVEYVVEPRTVRPPKPVAVRPEDVTSPHIEQWELEWKAKQEASSQKKQTVFNEHNYQPRGPVNSIAPPPSRYYDQGQARTNAQVREINRSFNGTRTTRSARLSWKSEKSYRSGTFTYIETDRGIETHSVCGNYKYGSFDYRDCRKAAKKYFQNACSGEFKAACAAGEMTP